LFLSLNFGSYYIFTTPIIINYASFRTGSSAADKSLILNALTQQADFGSTKNACEMGLQV